MEYGQVRDPVNPGTPGCVRQLPCAGGPPAGRGVRRPANALRVLGLASVFAVASAPVVHGQTWLELMREAADEAASESDFSVAASGDAILDLQWVGGRESRRLDGVLENLVWLDEAGGVVVPDELVSLTVAPGGSGAALGWPEAASLLAGVLVHRHLMDQTLPAEMHPIPTGDGTVQVPQPFVRSAQIASLGLLERLLKDRSVRRKLFAEAALRALTLDEAKRYDERLAPALASSLAAAPTLLGATDVAASAGVNAYTQLRIIAGVQQAAQHAARGGDVAATVQGRMSRSGLGRSTRALGVLAYGVALVENVADARARNRLLLAAAEHALAVRGLEDTQRLLAAADSDPAMVAGLSDAVAELTARSRSRLTQYAAMGREAVTDSAVPTLAVLAAGAVGSGGLALVLQQAADLSEQLADYVGAVLTVSAMATIGEDLRARTEALISGDEVGGTGAADYAVRALMDLHRRLAAETAASVYSILWLDRWSRATSLGGLGRAVGLTLAERFTGEAHTQEAFAQEVEWRVGQVRASAEFNARLPDILVRLRRFYAGPMDETDDDLRLVAGVSRTFDGIEFVWIPAGEFLMGVQGRVVFDDELPVTRVRISEGFWFGRYEVTQTEWRAVMGTNPSGIHCGRCPALRTSWNDVQEFIRTINARAGGTHYRLPTEAEWEYAARAATSDDRYSADLDAIAWCDEPVEAPPHPVGQKAPNAWGLQDMLGNAWEWVQDRYGAYPGGSVTDPQGPGSGSKRVARGGGWTRPTVRCRVSARGKEPPDVRFVDAGFRLVRAE